MNRIVLWVPVAVVAVGAAGYLIWQMTREVGLKPEPPRAEAPPPAPATPAEPQVRHPIEQARPQAQAADTAPLPPLAESDKLVQDALTSLIGADSVRTFLNVDGFVRRVVVTVDNLPRKKVALRQWPVQPTAERFLTAGKDDGVSLDPSNARRYAPFVQLVESVDTGKAVALYVRFYPLFQRAYADLGYPDHYFNDRLVEVIDHLLATPTVTGPIKLARPWVMYEYADPALESRSAGQKILVRMGPENAARLKAKLREIRQKVTGIALKE
jgi:Protein of unknown function (DUF3014)